MNNNIFSALAKYNSAIDENYLTESFVFVIDNLNLYSSIEFEINVRE